MSALDTQVGGNHYKDCKIQPVQYIEANNLRFLEGNIVKRVTRHDKPTGKGRQDIEKAIHELQLLLEHRYPLTAEQHFSKQHPPSIQVPHKLMAACIVCGKSDGHGGLQCPNTVAYNDTSGVG